MQFKLENYEENYYKSQTEETRLQLVQVLAQSKYSDKLSLLKRIYLFESNIQIKFDIRSAIEQSEKEPKLNSENPLSIDSKLQSILQSQDLNIRHRALSQMVRDRRVDLLPQLKQLFPALQDSYVDAAVLKLLSLDTPRNYKEIISYLKSEDDRVVASVIEILGNSGDTQSIATVAQYINHPNNRIQTNAAIALAKPDPKVASATILKMVNSQYPAYRISAAYALGVVELDIREEALEILLQDQDQKVLAAAHKAKQKISEISKHKQEIEHDSNAIEELSAALNSSKSNSEKLALISKINSCNGTNEDKLQLLKPYLVDDDDEIRRISIRTAGSLWPKARRSAFIRFLEDPLDLIVGETILVLCNQDKCPDEYYKAVSEAFNKLINWQDNSAYLTAINCINQCRDERFLSILSVLVDTVEESIKNKIIELLEDWSQTSTRAKTELNKLLPTSALKLNQSDNKTQNVSTEDISSETTESKVTQSSKSITKIIKPTKNASSKTSEETIVYLNKLSTVVSTLLSVMFVLGGIWLLTLDPQLIENKSAFTNFFNSPLLVYTASIIAILFFGGCCIYGIRRCLDTTPGLVISSKGIFDNSNAVSLGFIHWEDIIGIQENRFFMLRQLSLLVKNPEKYILRGNIFQRLIHRCNLTMLDTPIHIGTSQLQIKHKNLIKVIRRYFNIHKNLESQELKNASKFTHKPWRKYIYSLLPILVVCFFMFDGCFQSEFQILKRLAVRGDTDAQDVLGLMYVHGEGVKQDYQQAFYWFKKSSRTRKRVSTI